MLQSPFTILTPIRSGREAALSDILRASADATTRNADLGLSGLDRLHYASLSIVPGTTEQHNLVFEGNVDGSPVQFLEQLLDRSGPAVDSLYRNCEGYPPLADGDRAATLRYLKDRDIGATTFYVAWPGQTVDLIRREDGLRRWIQEFLDDPLNAELRAREPAEIHRAVVEAVGASPLRWALLAEPLPFLVRRTRTVIALLAGPLVTVLGGLAVAAAGRGPLRRPARVTVAAAASAAVGSAIRLRAAERADDRARPADWEAVFARWSDNLREFRALEDVEGQNHLTSVADVKPGRFRLMTLRAVLAAIRIAATLSPVRGQLSGIRSIHFARWVITPDRRQLIFLSNFDGSWESYLGDFIDLAAHGLTAVWTNSDNAIGFPRTTWLVEGGARDEARFKAFARRGMVPTLLWHNAYPNLSVVDIFNNRAVRTGLQQPLDAAATETWLRLL